MQQLCSAENPKMSETSKPLKPASINVDCHGNLGDESVLDVSGRSLEVSSLESSSDDVEGFYLYKNVFNLMPKSLGGLGRLRRLKFFGNEINLFPQELGNLGGLECLQLKIPSPGFGGLPLRKLEGLRELELSKVHPRLSAFPILSEIVRLKCLTNLSVCHFSIRYLPPEIGCLHRLEYLDLSFNKMKNLPTEISHLNALISLKVANNKLVELPSALSSLQRLENLDVSNNRLTSLGSLELQLMHNLQNLNLQYNKLLSCCQIPSWIYCNMEGNGRDASNDDNISSSETALENDGIVSSNGCQHMLSTLCASSLNNQSSTARRSGKRWKRQQHLNNSKKWKGADGGKVLTREADKNVKSSDLDVLASGTSVECASDITGLHDSESKNLLGGAEDNEIGSEEGFYAENCSCVSFDSTTTRQKVENECCECDVSPTSTRNGDDQEDEASSMDTSKSMSKSKRHCDKDLDNPKPCKSPKPAADCSNMSCNCNDDDNKQIVSGDFKSENLLGGPKDYEIDLEKRFHAENCSSVGLDSTTTRQGVENENYECDASPPSTRNGDGQEDEVSSGLDSTITTQEVENECCECDVSPASTRNGDGQEDEASSAETSKSMSKLKRHCDRDLDNPKPCKSRKPVADCSNMSCKYNNVSFCGIEDCLPDGFYDAGRDRPFMSLSDYEQNLHLDSREVILLDRERDEELEAITISAQAMVSRLMQLNGLTRNRDQGADILQIASLLALFVSDHFWGSDRGAIIERTRKAVSGSNYEKPFVCTCSTGNIDNVDANNKAAVNTVEDIIFSDLCEKSIHSIKARKNSSIVPIGSLRFGVCRHRALLMKYLCDRIEPRVPCELVRGYLDFFPHAWNIVLIKSGDSWLRMIVDACRPHDMREETDTEYFSRYIPLRRTQGPLSSEIQLGAHHPFPAISTFDELGKGASGSLVRCKFGTFKAVAKVRSMEVCASSGDELRNFEYSCLGEVRILGALKHSCIVEIYGHQICYEWIPSVDGTPERSIIKSLIFFEHIEGGSLKSYLEKLAKTGKKHVPMELALCIARDVACALAEMHSKHIIHRDIKSENILIDLDGKSTDGMPIVKLCDFDRSVPLRSYMHTCCIAHIGVPSPNVCVGTPHWMAPEVVQAMHKHTIYGLEVDIWSFGCLLLELLTLEIPYFGLSDAQMHDQLQIGERPSLTDEVLAMTQFGAEQVGSEAEVETLRFLADLFRRCTEKSPENRPTADELYETLRQHTSEFSNSKS